jgi:hypothetical protein
MAKWRNYRVISDAYGATRIYNPRVGCVPSVVHEADRHRLWQRTFRQRYAEERIYAFTSFAQQNILFDTGEINFAERVVLAKVVVPEPLTGLQVAVEDCKSEIGTTLVEI